MNKLSTNPVGRPARKVYQFNASTGDLVAVHDGLKAAATQSGAAMTMISGIASKHAAEAQGLTTSFYGRTTNNGLYTWRYTDIRTPVVLNKGGRKKGSSVSAINSTRTVKPGEAASVEVGKNDHAVVTIKRGAIELEVVKAQGAASLEKMPQSEWATLPKTAKEARVLGADWYFTNEPCKFGHVFPRRTSTMDCAKCRLDKQREKIKQYKETTDKMGAIGIINNIEERNVTSRATAAGRYLRYYFDPAGCKKGHHECLRYTRSGLCVPCMNKAYKESRDRQTSRRLSIDNGCILEGRRTIVVNKK